MSLKKLLITGFEPFGGESINPSWEAVSKMPEIVGNYKLTKLKIPTVFGRAADVVLEATKLEKPDVVLSIGQAGGRNKVTPEVVAINLKEATMPDNDGNLPVNEPVYKGAPAAYFSTVPVRAMVESIEKASLPSKLSYSAGVYVCNDVLYSLLHHFDGTQTLAGFIHVPFLKEQAKNGQFGMSLEDITRALCAAVEALP